MSAHCRIDARPSGPSLTTVSVVGELDIADADQLEHVLAAALRDGRDVVVDLTAAPFVDVVPFGILVRHDAAARPLGLKLVLVADPAVLRRLLETVRTGPLVVSEPDAVEAALLRTAPAPAATGAMQERLMDAIVEEVAGVGWHATTVAHVVGRARATREDFYGAFVDRADCYRRALRTRMGDQHARWLAAIRAPGAPLDGPRRAVEQYLTRLADQPAVARCYLLENPTRTGPGATRIARRRFELARALQARLGARQPGACHAFVAAVPAVASDHVAVGRTAELPALVEPLVDTLRPLVA